MATPPPPQPPQRDHEPTAGATAAGEERCGPLLAERFVKDDGRSLIRYRRIDADDE